MPLPKRPTLSAAVSKSILPSLFWLGAAFAIIWNLPDRAWISKEQGLIVIGTIGIWRYSWQFVNILRSSYYSNVVFPSLRRLADSVAVKYPHRLYFMIPSYYEEPYVSERVFKALVREIQKIPSEVKAFVTVGSNDEAQFIQKVVRYCRGHEKLELVLCDRPKANVSRWDTR